MRIALKKKRKRDRERKERNPKQASLRPHTSEDGLIARDVFHGHTAMAVKSKSINKRVDLMFLSSFNVKKKQRTVAIFMLSRKQNKSFSP